MKCPVTGLTNCRQRDCELHYMDAQVRLLIEQPVQGPQTPEQTKRYADIVFSLAMEMCERGSVTTHAYDQIVRDACAMVMETFELDVDDHSCNTWAIEVGLIDCGYACKTMHCKKCDRTFDGHRRVYGCPQG